MIAPYVPPNPWVWSANDVNGYPLTCTVQWNANNKALKSASIVRDPNCALGHLYFGVGPDGTPNTAPGAYAVATGTTSVTAQQLSSGGLNLITDITALQITAGP